MHIYVNLSEIHGYWLLVLGPRVLAPESMPENGGKLPKIAIRGPRGGGAMASALFHKNNPVKKHIG